MVKLNQIIAIANGKKTSLQKSFTDIYQKLGKSELFNGLARVYVPTEDGGESQPPESKSVQYKTSTAIEDARKLLTELFDVTLTQDNANTLAKADVVVDGVTVLANVPVTYLLFLEKQITDLKTFVSKLPTLDPAESWEFDSNYDLYKTKPIVSNRSKKVYKTLVKAEATKEHPAQVEVYTEDVKVGEWNTTKYCSAISAKEKNEMLDRITKLDDAIKFARENANNLEVTKQNAGESVLNFVFGK